MSDYLNFAAGPVQMDPEILAIGAVQPPYFRTAQFSALMRKMEEQYLGFLNASRGSRAIFLTSSGTGGMEAAVRGVLTPEDRVLAVNGGSFGNRFCELCRLAGVPYTPVVLSPGEALTEEKLEARYADGMTALTVNLCETSTGTSYDLEMLSGFCRAHGLLMIADAVSAFITQPIDMSKSGADVVITASQKALACAPGISPVAFSPRAVERIAQNSSACEYYFDLRKALNDGARGQTCYTPSLSVLLQMACRFDRLSDGGLERETRRIAALAERFRSEIVRYPFSLASQSPANACTAIRCEGNGNAYAIFERLIEEKQIYICPSGGEWRSWMLRVGHMGALRDTDLDRLMEAFDDLNRRGLL